MMKFMKLNLKELNNQTNCSWIACLSSHPSQRCVIAIPAYGHRRCMWCWLALIWVATWSHCLWWRPVFRRLGPAWRAPFWVPPIHFQTLDIWRKRGRWVRYVVGALESEDVSHLHFIEHLEEVMKNLLFTYVCRVLYLSLFMEKHGEATSLMNEPCCFILWKHVQFVFNFVQRIMTYNDVFLIILWTRSGSEVPWSAAVIVVFL